MNRRHSPSGKLQLSLLALLLALALSAGAAFWAHSRLAAAEAGNLTARAAFQALQMHQPMQAAHTPDLPQHLALFDKLQTQGRIPPPDTAHEEEPLAWAELLADIAAKIGLQELRHEISPAHILSPTPNSQFFAVRRVKFKLHLAHEEELLRLLDALHQRAAAFVLLRSCRLTRLSPDEPALEQPQRAHALHSPHAQLLANCESDWVSFRRAV